MFSKCFCNLTAAGVMHTNKVMPNYVISQAPNRVVLRNYEGVITTYTEPTDYKDECHCEECEKARRKEGVAELLSGGRLSLEPSELSRKTRNHNH